MKKLIQQVTAYLHRRRRDQRIDEWSRRKAAAEIVAESDIQIREWRGDVYLTFQGVPLLPESCFHNGITAAVCEMREVYAEYLSEQP